VPPPRSCHRLRRASLAAALLLAAAAAGAAGRPRIPLEDTPLEDCPGDPIAPSRTVEGRFPRELEGSYVMLPFEVPAGTTQVRVKYCFEGGGHTVDLGLWQAREGSRPWGEAQFRGWGGSSHPDVRITPQGFSEPADYATAPLGHVAGRTTRGFLPGPIPPGSWAAELGVGGVIGVDEGDEDGFVDWRVEIELADDPAFAEAPYVPEPYDATPASSAPGWYVGDMHVHAEHSALGDATMAETFDFAFKPIAEGGAGLDFITLSDYVTPSAWGEIGHYQKLHPGKLVIRSSEVITYRGHTNNHASVRYVDHRMGAVYELLADGALRRLQRDRDPRKAFQAVQAAGGWTQLNHVRTCPSELPGCRTTCRGCAWEYSRRETRFAKVDAIEVATAPTFLFARPAIRWWEEQLDRGVRLTAVGSSDSHHAGSPESGLQAPIGTGATVVFASELSEQGIADGIRAGHAYVKVFGSAMPDLYLEATPPGSTAPPAIMGDTVRAGSVAFAAQVRNVEAEDGALELVVLKDGEPIETVPVAAPGADHAFVSSGPGRYRLELRREREILVLTNPIYVARR
jgi:hypothetical protein